MWPQPKTRKFVAKFRPPKYGTLSVHKIATSMRYVKMVTSEVCSNQSMEKNVQSLLVQLCATIHLFETYQIDDVVKMLQFHNTTKCSTKVLLSESTRRMLPEFVENLVCVLLATRFI